jgi:sugar diacid utilization regulator
LCGANSRISAETHVAEDEVLTETVLAFAEAGLNMHRSGERMRVHPNTVQYRLQRVAEITGWNPKRFGDLLHLIVAIRLPHPPGGR